MRLGLDRALDVCARQRAPACLDLPPLEREWLAWFPVSKFKIDNFIFGVARAR
jgi:hypothetical protein